MTHFLISGFLVLAVAVTTAADETPFKITLKRDNDKVEVKVEQEKTVFSVHSPFGISNAVIERTGETWPDAKVRIWKDGKEDAPLDAKSPYWMQIRMVGGDGKPAKTIPLRDDFYEMQLPTAFFEGNPKSITVNWIDFYRN
jgi:hypothetical protein